MLKQMLKLLPNFFTLSNLMCGIIGIHMIGEISVVESNYFFALSLMKYSAIIIFLGAIFDFLDGLSAKLFKAHSEEGKILDSLADLVTFGLLPAYMMHKLLIMSTYSGIDKYSLPLWIYTAPLSMPCFTAYRLARFSVKNTTSHFQGMSSTAVGITIASFVFAISNDHNFSILKLIFSHNYCIVVIVLMFSLLMVSSLKFISFKFNSFKITENKWRYFTICCSILSIVFYRELGLAVSCLLYIILSLVNNFFDQSHN